MTNLEKDTIQKIVPELGRQALTRTYRQLLLAVISELWVDYLTQMEALRVSIGLEAYAQRDPLVQYKNRASALFQELIDNMRTGVISRMFTFKPRDPAVAQKDIPREGPQPAEIQAPTPANVPESNVKQVSSGSDKKRRRRRRK